MNKEETPQRRVVLRAAMTPCCAAWAPVVGVGAGAESATAVPADAPAANADAAPPATGDKPGG